MKKFFTKKTILFFIAVVFVIGLLVYIVPRQKVSSKDPMNGLPTLLQPFSLTDDPNATESAIHLTDIAGHPLVIPTPIIISKVTDLSPGIPDINKYRIVIEHVDGTFEQFNVGTIPSGLDSRQLAIATVAPEVFSIINMKPGDKIISAGSLAAWNTSQVSLPTPSPTSSIPTLINTPKPVNIFYPYPVNPTGTPEFFNKNSHQPYP